MNSLQNKIAKQITGSVIIVVIVFLFITSCKVIPTVETDSVINIERTSATGGGKVLDDGNADVSVRGVCWGTNQSPTIANSKTVDGSGIGTFTSSISQLTPGTLYYVKAYASNSKGTAYGNEVSFTTGQVIAPTLTTAAVTSITLTTAVSGGDITADGGGAVTARGVCWSIASNPAITDSHTTDGTGTGSFTSNLTSLTPGTQYYVRAYSTNSAGTSYGNEVPFTTGLPVIATLTTTEATSITTNSAMSGGNISNDGGSAVTARGVCWATTINPTISNSKTIDGTGTGLYTSNISGLSPCTTYHIRAYATNSKGTAYGSDIPFTTNTVIPTINMNAASNIGSSTATLSGTVNANGSPATVSFEYGLSTSFGSTIAATPSQVAGTSNTSVSAVITGLIPNTQYYYRIQTVICGETIYGNDQTFMTLCPSTISVMHSAGSVAPVNKTVTYGIVQTNLSGTNKCWITKNLGADNQGSSATDTSEAAAGWYWQFNRKQGYKHDGTTLTPNSTWLNSIDENSNWTLANDPCAILLGTGWRIPTSTEWTNAQNSGGWLNYNNTYASVLKLHAAGVLGNGVLSGRGQSGNYWSSVQPSSTNGTLMYFTINLSYVGNNYKWIGISIRCLKD